MARTLEARWEDDGTIDGEVSQDLFWVDTLDDNPPEDKCHPVSASDRGLIQLYYTPASRDAAAQIRATTGALAARLLRAIEWSSETEEAVQEASESLSAAFEAEAAIAAIGKALEERWSGLHDEVVDTKPRLSLVSRRFEEVVSKLAVIFEQGPDGHERGLDALSDGQQSLFYFALAAAVFDLERKVVAGDVEGFLDDQLRIPALTLFALEEPENPVPQGVWVRFPPPAPFKIQQLFKKRDRGNGTQSRTFLLRHDLIDRQFNNS